jgi:flagellin
MSINTNLSTNSASSADILGRSLESVARRASKLDLLDELTVSGKFDTQRQQAQSDLADVQNAVSAAQSADGQLGQVGDLLTQMRQLVTKGDDKQFQPKFEALQEQLRALIGTAAPAGGLPSGAAAQSLVNQNDSGRYTATLATSNVGETIDTALQEIGAGRSGLADGLAKLNHRAAALQIEYANLDATIPSLQSEDAAASATQLAKYALFNQPASALSAQSAGRAPGSAFKLLQD